MKIYKSNYRDHWISPYTIMEYVFFWTAWSKCGRNQGVIEDCDYVDHPAWVERAAMALDPICTLIKRILDFVRPEIRYVKIDPWDTWSMDHTLSDIILPMLRQLQTTKHGAPHVDDEDVPEHLRNENAPKKENDWDTDEFWHDRWDWVLAEMIWAFEQKVTDDAESQFFDHTAYDTGDTLDVKQWCEDVNNRVSKIKYDEAGHRAWQARKSNGLRLFGKYYEALWD